MDQRHRVGDEVRLGAEGHPGTKDNTAGETEGDIMTDTFLLLLQQQQQNRHFLTRMKNVSMS